MSGLQIIFIVFQDVFLPTLLSEILPSKKTALHSELQMLWVGSWQRKDIWTQMKGVKNNWAWKSLAAALVEIGFVGSRDRDRGDSLFLYLDPCEFLLCCDSISRGIRHIGAVNPQWPTQSICLDLKWGYSCAGGNKFWCNIVATFCQQFRALLGKKWIPVTGGSQGFFHQSYILRNAVVVCQGHNNPPQAHAMCLAES